VGDSRDIVVLSDGATMVARPGTRDRAMAEWIAAAKEREAGFAVGDKMFVRGSNRMTAEGLGDAATLATILRATPDARIAIIGIGEDANREAGTTRLADQRARALATFLEERGLKDDRWHITPQTGGPPQQGQLRLVARRGSALEPFETASR
jgi:outer membrane protein OmpA-like peptidoglycan-associated protein